jgi:hypothetical protein
MSRWPTFAVAISNRLTTEDDEQLWRVAIDDLFADAEFLIAHARVNRTVLARIGSCSHWLSPHNGGSWLPDARYAWPSGYGGSGWSILGLPDFDWYLDWQWTGIGEGWVPVDKIVSKRPLTFRVTVPARTVRHPRAVVHTLWTPGSPTTPRKKLLRAYGFMKAASGWECTSTSGRGEEFEALEGLGN